MHLCILNYLCWAAVAHCATLLADIVLNVPCKKRKTLINTGRPGCEATNLRTIESCEDGMLDNDFVYCFGGWGVGWMCTPILNAFKMCEVLYNAIVLSCEVCPASTFLPPSLSLSRSPPLPFMKYHLLSLHLVVTLAA